MSSKETNPNVCAYSSHTGKVDVILGNQDVLDTQFILGDLNNDNEIDILDVVLVVQIILEL